MNKRVFIFLFLIPFYSFSGNGTMKKRILGFSFSPEYSYRFLSSTGEYDWIVELRDGMEVPKTGYTIGFNFSYKVKNKIFINVAACYSNKGEKTKKSDLIYSQQIPENPVSMFTRYTYGFCEIPLTLNYQIFDSSSFFTSIGFSVNIPVFEKRKNFYTYGDGSESHNSDYSINTTTNICLSGVAGIGYYFKFGKYHFIKAEPFIKCNITSAAGKNVKEYFYSYGLEIGFYLGR